MNARTHSGDLPLGSSANARAGTTLVELLVALPLTVLVAVMAVALLLHVAKAGRGQWARLATTRELRHARLVLARDLESVHGTDIRVLTDTLLEFRAHLGVLVLCTVPSGMAIDVAVPDTGAAGDWVSAVRAGDDLIGWALPHAPSDTPQRWMAPIVAPPKGLGVGTCGPAPMVPPRPRWRLTVAATSGVPLAPGMPVGIGRPVRYRHYQSGSRWWLGRRTRDAAGWDVTQPVAGPLLSATEHGMALQGFSHRGVPTTWPDSMALLRIVLRASRRVHDARSGHVDSAAVEVPLRAAPAQGPPA
ncbi:MAG: type II secretion system protein J [Gemmatimonadaceae bacterium]